MQTASRKNSSYGYRPVGTRHRNGGGLYSLRRFNDLFKNQYKLSPTALRKQVSEEKKQNSDVALSFGYRPPYHWERMLDFLAGRTIIEVETVKNCEYMRTAHMVTPQGKHVYDLVRIGHRPQKNALVVTVSETLLSVLPQVLARIRRLFDLYCDPDAVYETRQAMNGIHSGPLRFGDSRTGLFQCF
jgi:AraC family transcriptional regulator of adaptative response / DNA-3-methyladenine glycosylase II